MSSPHYRPPLSPHRLSLLFSDPVWSGKDTIPSTIIRNLTALWKDIAYNDDVTDNLTVLTSKYTATENGVLQGLLYVPDLDSDDPCADYARQYVPDSAVRQSDLPATNYNLIAVAPWFNSSCTKAYLASAREDPLRAFLFYVPTGELASTPDSDSDIWDLGDGGSWKSENHYPIFAVSGSLGSEMMYQLGLYSGNITEVPNGDNISNLYNPDSSDYIRIWTQLTVTTPTGLPNVWVFVLAIAGVVLVVVILTVFLMHAVWRRRRISLRRRVVAGDVNLEIMNIKRLTVPACHVHKFPLFTYSYDPPQSPPLPKAVPSSPTGMTASAASPALTTSQPLPYQSSTTLEAACHHNASAPGLAGTNDFAALSSTLGAESRGECGTETNRHDPTASSTKATFVAAAPVVGDLDYQPTCQICLENFEDRATIIRELPCGHIFHPDCIDEFLCQISSLCPLCKASMLPRGYCPIITNAMVRRERAIRRLRERVDVAASDDESAHGRIRSWGSSVSKRLHSSKPRLPPTFSASIELAAQTSPTDPTAQRHDRRAVVSEATRRRMRHLARTDADREETDRPRWRIIGRKVFPGFL
ncbi:ring finger domain protein [Grosmannia clavigera kw1407]|uniref:Ring finger domain protein n=1 Tax=Grosmannia clavigera (strain kw1407 / UAMH 11150) TaxID=655863 RepID=F0X9Z7_GROCL|nr:ring finger domain protein [Grosmannia clavigera kw1407]EFX05461.1 ring finger domain protein [Grosmannia clavigera kw1407]